MKDFLVDKNSLGRVQALLHYKIPKIGSEWVNKNSGEIYRVYDYTNLESTRRDYPIRVSYIRSSDNSKWSRELSEWHRSFEEIWKTRTTVVV
jgi:hypothetical protein